MRLGSIKFLLIIALFCATPHLAFSEPLDKADLIGRWDYTSYTALQNGKLHGTVQFKPGTMVFTYHENGTWEMAAADATHTKLNGNYEIHGTELIMKKADGSPYQDFDVQLEHGGKTMTMKDQRSIVTASKVEATP
jgi:hypothetical protein